MIKLGILEKKGFFKCIDKIEIDIFEEKEKSAEDWIFELKGLLNNQDVDFGCGSKKIDFVILLQLSGKVVFDFYEIEKFKELLLKEKILKNSIDFKITFFFPEVDLIEEVKIISSKTVKFDNLINIVFKGNRKLPPIYFDVDENFFKNLNLKDNSIIFENAVEIGFANPVSPKNLPIIWKFLDGIVFYKDFENFYYFFKNSDFWYQLPDKELIKSNILIFSKPITVKTCKQYQQLISLYPNIRVKSKTKCKKIQIKNFGKNFSKDTSFSWYFKVDEHIDFDEIVFDKNTIPLSDFSFRTGGNIEKRKKLVLKNLKDVNYVSFQNPMFSEIKIENGEFEIMDLFDFFDTSLFQKIFKPDDFLVKLEKCRINDELFIPCEFFDRVSGEKNSIVKVKISIDPESKYFSEFEMKIFNKNLYNKLLEKYDGNEILSWIFYIFVEKVKDGKNNLFEFLKQYFENQLGDNDLVIEISPKGFKNMDDEYEFKRIFNLVLNIIYTRNKDFDKFINFLKLKRLLS